MIGCRGARLGEPMDGATLIDAAEQEIESTLIRCAGDRSVRATGEVNVTVEVNRDGIDDVGRVGINRLLETAASAEELPDEALRVRARSVVELAELPADVTDSIQSAAGIAREPKDLVVGRC